MGKTKKAYNKISDFIDEINLKSSEYEDLKDERINKKEYVEFLLSEMQREGLFTKVSKQFFHFLFLSYPYILEKLFIIYGEYRINKTSKAELCDLANEFLSAFDDYQNLFSESLDLLIELNALRNQKESFIRKRKRKK